MDSSQPAPPVPPPLPLPLRRSRCVTVLGWVAMIVGGLGLPISFITAAMLLVRSYGTANATFVDSCVMVFGPALLFVTGLGLLRRWRWAWFSTLAILLITLAIQPRELVEVPRRSTPTPSPSGVPTTVNDPVTRSTSLPMVLLCVAAIAWLNTKAVRGEFRIYLSSQRADPKASAAGSTDAVSRNWRAGHRGRDMMYYEEQIAGVWQRLDIDGEMLIGRTHHVIYFASPESWQSYPEWARSRRDEIIDRIKSEFREPDYEYQGGGTASAIPEANAPARLHAAGKEKPTAKQWLAVFAAILLMGALSVGMGWLVLSGIQQGQTWLPTKRASLQRPIFREQEPIFFYATLGLYSLVGVGAAYCSLWMMREAGKLSRR
ncbi:MAG: hypothetical protein H7A55_14725 [Verrucomicrobiaceae bacterium]|nr:hypothetical protein [Verrucomicrobiaceae bacterium]